MTRDRARAERTGRRAEALAAALLLLKGYAVLARRFRAGGGEVDIVARKKRTLVFVEVKTRATIEEALDAVTARGRRRIESAARSFAARRPRLAGDAFRYDVVAVAGWRCRHFVDAWREGEGGR